MNLSNIITRGARYFPEKKALAFETSAFTYRELNDCVNRVAGYLQEKGVKRDDRVAIYSANSPEWIMTYYAVMRLGAAVVPISAAYKSSEVTHMITDTGARLALLSEALATNVPSPGELPSLEEALIFEKDPVLSALREEKGEGAQPVDTVECEPDDMCKVLFTGGTTGIPKGAMISHKNLLYTAQNVCYHERLVPGDAGLCFMPLNHVFASIHIMISTLYAGATLVLHKGFDMDEIISSIGSNKVTRLYAVPTVYIRFLNTPECHKHLRSVKYSFSAATSMPSEIVRQWKDTFGLAIHEAYGMTETSSLVTFNHIFQHRIGSVGTPAGIVEVKIIDPDGRELPNGQDGEIIIRGPNVTKGYLNRPDETAKTFSGDWLHSGDVGHFDEDGYVYIVDRLKDVIITGGLNVFPNEVEEVIYTHEAVEECSVVGLPNEEYGEAVTAFIRLKKDHGPSEGDLIRFCKEKMASYKAPKKILFVDDFPRTPQGKILKRELRKGD